MTQYFSDEMNGIFQNEFLELVFHGEKNAVFVKCLLTIDNSYTIIMYSYIDPKTKWHQNDNRKYSSAALSSDKR